MIPRDEVHVVFGTGPVGLAVMRELHGQGKRVRLVNRSGAAAAPQGVEVVKGNAADQAFTRQVCRDATVIYNCVNAPYTDWAALLLPMHASDFYGQGKTDIAIDSTPRIHYQEFNACFNTSCLY